jgi:hypothetical protein
LGPVQGNFNHRTKHFRRAIADGQFEIVDHFDLLLLWVGEGVSGAGNQAGIMAMTSNISAAKLGEWGTSRRNYYNRG